MNKNYSRRPLGEQGAFRGGNKYPYQGERNRRQEGGREGMGQSMGQGRDNDRYNNRHEYNTNPAWRQEEDEMVTKLKQKAKVNQENSKKAIDNTQTVRLWLN